MLAIFRRRVAAPFCQGSFPALLWRFIHQQSGNVVIIFALAAIPLTLSVGAAVDYSVAIRTKAALNAYADAAALLAVNKSSMSLAASAAQANAIAFFKAQAATLKSGSLGTVSATVADSTAGRSAVVSYTASVPTAFMGLASINTITIDGTSTANSAVTTYLDFYLLLDNTPSMGVLLL